VDWECGGRDKVTCERLIERLRRWRTRLFCADDYAVYGVLLPVGQLYTGKDETHGIERDNARQRHWLARFRRRSIVVSKATRMVDVSIALFARFAGNDRIADLISMLAKNPPGAHLLNPQPECLRGKAPGSRMRAAAQAASDVECGRTASAGAWSRPITRCWRMWRRHLRNGAEKSRARLSKEKPRRSGAVSRNERLEGWSALGPFTVGLA